MLFSVYGGSNCTYKQVGFYNVAGAFFVNGFASFLDPFAHSRHVVLIESHCASTWVVLALFHRLNNFSRLLTLIRRLVL